MGIDVPSGPEAFLGTALTAALQTVPDADVKIIDRITVGHVQMMVAPLCLSRTCHAETAVKEIACVDSGCLRSMTPSDVVFLDFTKVTDGSHVIVPLGENIPVVGRGTYCESINGCTCVFPDFLHISLLQMPLI